MRGASLPTHQPRALPGLPPGRPYLPLEPGPDPSPFLGRGLGSPPSLCLGRRGASLGCYTSRTETVLGPPGGLGLKRGWRWGLGTCRGRGPLTLSPSPGPTFCSLKVNVSVLWALPSVPQTVCVGAPVHLGCGCTWGGCVCTRVSGVCVCVCVCVWREWTRALPLAQALHPQGEGRWPSRGGTPGVHLLP